MDLTTVIVLAVTAIVVVVLVFFERDSRRNDAKLKAELAGKANSTPQPSPAPIEKAKRRVPRKAF